MSIFHNLFVTLEGNELAGGSRGGAPESSVVLVSKLLSDEHILIPYCDTGKDTNWCWVQGAEPFRSSWV